MVDRAWVWAQKTGNLRRSEIHGEEEARLLLSDTFQLLDEEGQELQLSGTIDMEVSWLNVLSAHRKQPYRTW